MSFWGLWRRRKVLAESAAGTIAFALNQPPWALASQPKQLGMGLYLD